MDKRDYKYQVCVRCFTYNHSQYISSALDGFVMQHTDFPYLIMIVDDASTDGEQSVIANYVRDHFDMSDAQTIVSETDYAEIHYAQHRTNKNCFVLIHYLKYNHYKKQPKLPYLQKWRDVSKYEALCEGDDYWTDPYKLQKQVDFLDANPEYSMCFHDVYRVSNDSQLDSYRQYAINTEVPVEDVILNGGLFCPTASIVYRHELLKDYPSFAKKCHVGDYPLQIYLALKGKVYFFADVMGCYRVGAPGSWTESILKADRRTRLSKMENEVEMLESFDRYSNNKYTQAFVARINKHKLLTYIDLRDKVGVKMYYPRVHGLDFGNKRLCFLIVFNLLFLININQYIKGKIRILNNWLKYIWSNFHSTN